MKDVALLFPGQGAQSVGMGRALYDQSAAAKAIFEEANAAVPGLTDVMFDGPAEKLTATQYCQPAIFTHSMAAYAALKEHAAASSLNVRFACGLSLGEYSALCASGALSFTKTLELVGERSQLMEEATQLRDGKMAAVIGMDAEKLKEICAKTNAEVA